MTVRLLMAARLIADAWPAATTRELTFAPVHRAAFPPYEPGDHVQLQHQDGTRRDYSLIGPTDAGTYTIAVRRDDHGRGGSVLFHDALHLGDLAFVSYPQPGMRRDAGTRRHLVIAGGIGITAVLSLIASVPHGDDLEVHYCVRTRQDAAYLDVLERLCTHVVVHESSTGDRLDAAELLREVREDTSLYYCGPASLMDAIAAAATRWDEHRLHHEAFTGSAPAGEERGESFDAWLALSRRVIHVGSHESLLQAMLREGVPLEYSCEGGACGSCTLEIVQGTVEHRDLCLSEEERTTTMTACVSRGQGAITVQA